MNIRAVLLGSAAAFAAMPAAFAADAVEVVAEPEPMEYVRVCDTYGTGYFYIPGTETCLRIGGYVRYDIGVGDGPYGGRQTIDHTDGGTNDTYYKEGRFSFQTWTGTETELGTLSTYTETKFNYVNGEGTSVEAYFMWIQLGGFRVGKDESAFGTFSDYAGSIIADDIIPYGPFETNLVSYTYDAGNGFSAILSLETGEAGSDYEIDSYMPHVVAAAKYTGDWGGVSLTGGYDSVIEEVAIKGRLDITINEQFSVFAMAAWGSTDDSLGDYGNFNNYKTWAGDWAAWVGGTYQFTDKASFNFQGSYTDGGDYIGDAQWALVADVDYELVKDLHIIPEVTYSDLDLADGAGHNEPGGDGLGGMLRIERSF
ncbi:MAG: porin [Rhizobiaceae bacterium]|nr:porin [Rhizobiaceae bacterium]